MIVLVPAYGPDERLVRLVADLRAGAPDVGVVVVDDGSGPEHQPLFEAARALGAAIVRHPRNLGKGRALRTGVAHVLAAHPGQDVVCADADGQHAVPDVLAVGDAVAATGATVLGVRRFTGDVPLRSRAGNAVTRAAFRLVTGRAVTDTQTGLRGYPAGTLPWLLTVPGDRFEYELHLLLAAGRAGQDLREVPIRTIYLEGNRSSHFRPLVDSLRVWTPLVRFAASSLLAFAVDTVALLVLHALTGALLPSVVAARLLSGGLNFAVNRERVFVRPDGVRRPLGPALLRYAALAVALLAAGSALLVVLTDVGLPLLVGKVLTEVLLVVASYAVQRRSVFGRTHSAGTDTAQVVPEEGRDPRAHDHRHRAADVPRPPRVPHPS
ncbi:glycosyltransferase [Cellulomonas endophytica]|uniref:glycosyltransferase n=1 Tax=Cellulomonas endophytica TaxID=2494735 RepID=UPI0010131DA8|nr:glycosyltransferase family 2 protein [Cellulomonas endophytica]